MHQQLKIVLFQFKHQDNRYKCMRIKPFKKAYGKISMILIVDQFLGKTNLLHNRRFLIDQLRTVIELLYIAAIPSSARNHGVLIGVASSLSTFILASLLFLTTGLACGCYWGQKGRRKSIQQTAQSTQSSPLYEDVVIQEQELELKENAAYSSIHQCGNR